MRLNFKEIKEMMKFDEETHIL